jgi:hypothetical protein
VTKLTWNGPIEWILFSRVFFFQCMPGLDREPGLPAPGSEFNLAVFCLNFWPYVANFAIFSQFFQYKFA